MKSCFCFFTDGKQHTARELDMIIAYSYDVMDADFENSLSVHSLSVHFRPIRKELQSSMYNKSK